VRLECVELAAVVAPTVNAMLTVGGLKELVTVSDDCPTAVVPH
jgi:hypothetical protein